MGDFKRGYFMIDREGYRHNVGIIITNQAGQLLFCRRVNMPNAWQFPQGGIQAGEQPLQAMYRELDEELGLQPADVEILAQTQDWVAYELPEQYLRHDTKPLCVGQKQKWFLLHLLSSEDAIVLDKAPKPEFDQWRWVDYWSPLKQVIAFKRDVYRIVLEEFASRVTNL